MEDQNSQSRGWILGIIIFVMGGCGLAYEYTFSRIASDLLGNSVRQWAVVIAIMLFCMGMGAEIQRFIPSKKVVRSLLASQIFLALLGGFGPLLMLLGFAHSPYHFGLIHYSLISFVGVLIGFEIPLITRINEVYSADIQNNLARVLKMDYIGALAGGLLWIFVLPRFFTLHETAYVLAFITLGATFLCWLYFKKHTSHPIRPLLGIIAASVILAFGVSQSDDWSFNAEQQLFRDRVIFSETTPYQHIVLTKDLEGDLRCYINGHIQFSSSDEFIYHENLVHPALEIIPSKKRILVLGGGDGLAVREVLKHPEVEEIVLVDLDPGMTRLASEQPDFIATNEGSLTDSRLHHIVNTATGVAEPYTLELPHQRRTILPENAFTPELHILNLDATLYARQAEGMFDLIILDFPDPSSPDLAKLYSVPFYQALKKKLNANGLIVQQSTSPFAAREAFLCIGRTFEAAGFSTLPFHDHVPSFGEWGWWVAGHQGVVTREDLASRFDAIDSLPENLRYLTPELIHASRHFGKDNLVSSHDDVSTLSQPAILHHYLRGWKQ